MSQINVGIWGAGFVGSATGYIFEQKCPDKVKVHYYDKFKECKSTQKEVLDCDFVFLCLPTPMRLTGEISLDYIKDSLIEIHELLQNSKRKPIFIIRSTSVSGSTDKFAEVYPEYSFAFCPEFLTEKNAKLDALNTNRIVIGANSTYIYNEVRRLFALAFGESFNYVRLSRKEAETLKYFSNIFLSAQVLLSNELYFICQKIDVDYDKVRKELVYDRRIGTFTQVPGPDGDYGVGGKCFPKDLNAFIYLAKQNGYCPTILETLNRCNEHWRIHKDWLDIKGAVESCKFDGEENV